MNFYKIVELEFVEYTSYGVKATMMKAPGSPCLVRDIGNHVINNPGLP